ncbi:MAG: 30S ribosomal protein S16 [Cyclobacteriaceae bacterium]
MATKIRLARRGRKRKALYDVVVADVRAPRDGRFIEKLGTYNPNSNPASIVLDDDKTLNWVMTGAQPTDTVRNILSYRGIMLRKHLQVGVNKGAITQEQADAKFEEWKASKDAQIQGKVDVLTKKKESDAQARLDAEAKVNAARAIAIQEKNVVIEPEAETEEAPEATEESTASVETAGATEEAPAAEAAPEVEEVKEEVPAAEEVKEEAPAAEEAPAEEPAKEEAPAEEKVEEVAAEAKEEAPAEEKVEEVAAEAKEEAPAEEEKKEEEK